MKDEMYGNMETNGRSLFNLLDKTQEAMEKSLKNARYIENIFFFFNNVLLVSKQF